MCRYSFDVKLVRSLYLPSKTDSIIQHLSACEAHLAAAGNLAELLLNLARRQANLAELLLNLAAAGNLAELLLNLARRQANLAFLSIVVTLYGVNRRNQHSSYLTAVI